MGGACTPTGGALSTDADLIDMRYTAGRLDSSGDAAHGLCGDVLRVAAHLPLKSALLSPGSAAGVATKVANLTIGPCSLGALGLRMEVDSQGVRAAASAYEAADVTTRNALAAIGMLVAPVRLGEAMLQTAALATAQSMADAPEVIGEVRGLPGPFAMATAGRRWGLFFVEDLKAREIADPHVADDAVAVARELFFLAAPSTHSFEGQVGLLLALGRTGGLFVDDTPLTVTAVPTRHQATPGPADLADLIDQEAMVESGRLGGQGHARVRVHHVTHPDGTGAWIVNIPGTQNWHLNGPDNPSDATANVASLAGVPLTLYPAVATAMRLAMGSAGVRPGAQPVMLVGHSQGGLVATRMVQNPAFRKQFDVTQVVTIASPVTRMKVPRGVHALEIEHRGDIVPALDGDRDAHRANAGQLSCDAAPPREGGMPITADPFALHGANLYARTAHQHLGRDSTDPLVRRFYDRSTGFFDGQDTRYDYNISRP